MKTTLESLFTSFESILNALPDGVFISDAEGTALFVNATYQTMTGLQQNQVQGRNVRDLVSEGIFDNIVNPEIVKTGKPVTHAQQLRDGKKLVLSGFPVFDKNKQILCVVTFARDITLLTSLQGQVEGQRQLIDQISDQLAHIAHENSIRKPVYESTAISNILDTLKTIAKTDATILIQGETGTGKEVFARLAHSLSSRGKKVLLKVDCGGISETLTESELFGYVPGAFTGASSKGKAGYFEIADGSTIFLDEIGELPLSMQTRLLRVLQDGEIMRVGSSTPQSVNVRVIAATNRNLSDSVQAGTFRSDLYYRLNVTTIRIPALRERTEDIRPLAEHFLQIYNAKYRKKLAFALSTIEAMREYSWPGNVRELQNMIHSIVITHGGSLITPENLPIHILGRQNVTINVTPNISSSQRSLKEIVADMERDFLLRAIEQHGSIQKVAKMFKTNRSTIFRKLNSLKNTKQDL